VADWTVHAERIVDGDSHDLTALTLYERGSPDTERTLAGTERLHITDILVMAEEFKGTVDIMLVADEATAGKYLLSAVLAPGVPYVVHFRTPYVCPKATVPAFAGPWGTGRTMCTVHGIVREA